MSDIDVYYKSLKRLYDDEASQLDATEAAFKKPRGSERFENGALGIFLLCLVPVIPFALTWGADKLSLSLGSLALRFNAPTFLLVWILTTTATGGLLALASRMENRSMKASHDSFADRKFSLSAEQQAFLFAYEAYEELRTYFVSHIDVHVDECLTALSRLLPEASLEDTRPQLAVPDIEMWYSMRPSIRYSSSSMEDQIRVARGFLRTFDKYTLLGIDDEARQTLQAIVEFPDKILDRLWRREELPAVLKVLERLVGFLYAFLPEHETYMQPDELESLRKGGRQQLAQFVHHVSAMTALKRQPSGEPAKKDAVARGWFAKARESGYVFVVVRFAAWFAAIFLLTSAGVYLASLRIALTPDTMATLVIGTSVAGAATLTAILPKPSVGEGGPDAIGPTNGST